MPQTGQRPQEERLQEPELRQEITARRYPASSLAHKSRVLPALGCRDSPESGGWGWGLLRTEAATQLFSENSGTDTHTSQVFRPQLHPDLQTQSSNHLLGISTGRPGSPGHTGCPRSSLLLCGLLLTGSSHQVLGTPLSTAPCRVHPASSLLPQPSLGPLIS